MRKSHYIEKIKPNFFNYIYDKRHKVVANSFSVNPEDVSRLKEIITRTCHEQTIIPEENIRELQRIFNRTRNQTMEIVEMKNCIKICLKN